jgi:OmpA-OmpF porin, OOP family
MRLRSVIVATAMCATPIVAMAQPVTGLYIQGGGGLNAPHDPQITTTGAGFGTGRGTLHEDFGWNGELAVGYGLGNGFRFEIEGDYMHANVRQLGIPFATTTNGGLRTYGVMANALFDMDVGSPYIYPYLGLGAGYQWTQMESVNTVGVARPFAAGFDSQQGAPAWQAIAGASFPIPYVVGLSLTADYRFMDILGGAKFDGLSSGGGPLTPAVEKMHNQFDHELVIGLRYAFNTPAPPPPAAPVPVAAPAPAPARSYLVFFDWDKASLTERARSIIKEAADNSTHVQYTRLEVNGYTDTSGTPHYNQGLSLRRARAVAGELVRDGVPKNAISIQGFGETHLLVATGPGVREPQNRRVEIIIR